ncbi:MAG: RNase adapter RapZ [Oscillospiraceae bacterium]
MKKIYIVTGLSGAGKSTVMDALEDIDFYCIDNIPHSLILSFIDITDNSNSMADKFAFGVDTRGGDLLKNLPHTISYFEKNNIEFKLIFLDARNDILYKRYKETRRKHPLYNIYADNVENLFNIERKLLSFAREKANTVIDTSNYTKKQLKEYINDIILDNKNDTLNVHISSFGFKYGIAKTADIVLDVRCLPNPFYVDSIKKKTGLDQEVRDYVFSFSESIELREKLKDLTSFLLPLYKKEGKSQLEIAIGCTGGKHRSVSMVEELYNYLKDEKYKIKKLHRDIEKV